MEMTLNMGCFEELSTDEMLTIDGGAWSWKEFGRNIVGGALSGAIGGAIAGGSWNGGIGAAPGAGFGALGGAAGGAAMYLVCGWW